MGHNNKRLSPDRVPLWQAGQLTTPVAPKTTTSGSQTRLMWKLMFLVVGATLLSVTLWGGYSLQSRRRLPSSRRIRQTRLEGELPKGMFVYSTSDVTIHQVGRVMKTTPSWDTNVEVIFNNGPSATTTFAMPREDLRRLEVGDEVQKWPHPIGHKMIVTSLLPSGKVHLHHSYTIEVDPVTEDYRIKSRHAAPPQNLAKPVRGETSLEYKFFELKNPGSFTTEDSIVTDVKKKGKASKQGIKTGWKIAGITFTADGHIVVGFLIPGTDGYIRIIRRLASEPETCLTNRLLGPITIISLISCALLLVVFLYYKRLQRPSKLTEPESDSEIC